MPLAPAIEEVRTVRTGEDIAQQEDTSVSEESQVVVHCTYKASFWLDGIRVWKSTFLISRDCGHRSELLHVENISLYPVWTRVFYGEVRNFTLIFAGLPRSCTAFDLVEEIPAPGGFEVENIARNHSDVYHVEIR